MPFTSKTAKEYGAKGNVVKKKQQEDLWAFLASGGMRMYQELLQLQYQGKELDKEQKEAMDRTEKLFPYVKARKTDVTTDGKELNQLLVKFVDEK